MDDLDHDQRELDRLQRFLTRPGLDFGLALALFADPVAARRLRAEALDRAAAAGCRVSSLLLGNDDLTADVIERLEQALADADAVFVSGLDELLADTLGHARRAPALVNLNMRRDQLPERLRGRVVLWVSKRGYPLLAKLAWDLLDVTLTRFEFVGVDPVEVEPLRLPKIWWIEPAAPSRIAGYLSRAESWRRRAESLSDVRAAADAASIAADQFVSAGEIERGAEMFELAVRQYRRISASEPMVRQLVPLARLHAYQGKVDLALDEAGQALQSAQVAGSWDLEAEAWQLIADIHRSRADLAAAEQALESLITRGEQRSDRRSVALALAKLGANATNWEIPRREQVLERATAMFKEIGDEHDWADSRNLLANLRLLAGRVDEAQDIYLGEVMPILEREGDERGMAHLCERMAQVRVAQGEIDRAVQIVRDEVLPVYDRLNDRMRALYAMLMIAELELRRGDLQASAKMLHDVIAEAHARGNLRLELFARLQLAHILELDGHPEQATEQANLARTLATQLGIDLGDDLTQALDRLRL